MEQVLKIGLNWLEKDDFLRVPGTGIIPENYRVISGLRYCTRYLRNLGRVLRYGTRYWVERTGRYTVVPEPEKYLKISGTFRYLN